MTVKGLYYSAQRIESQIQQRLQKFIGQPAMHVDLERELRDGRVKLRGPKVQWLPPSDGFCFVEPALLQKMMLTMVELYWMVELGSVECVHLSGASAPYVKFPYTVDAWQAGLQAARAAHEMHSRGGGALTQHIKNEVEKTIDELRPVGIKIDSSVELDPTDSGVIHVKLNARLPGSMELLTIDITGGKK